MRLHRLITSFISMAAGAACKGDQHLSAMGSNTPPLAYVRYFNAVPDTLPFDFRPIDQVLYSTPFLAVPFRAEGRGNYLGYQAGSRHIRIFPNSTDLATTSSIIEDSTLTLSAGVYYSFIHTGHARAGGVPRHSLMVLTEPITDPGANIAYRVINVGSDVGTVDVYVTAGAADPLPVSPTFAAVAFRSATAYVTSAPGPMTIRVLAAGTKAPEISSITAPAGSVTMICGLTNVGGSTIAGSVMTAMVYGVATLGSLAEVTSGSGANTTPKVVWWIDKAPSTITVPC
jgi:hypothetical protein